MLAGNTLTWPSTRVPMRSRTGATRKNERSARTRLLLQQPFLLGIDLAQTCGLIGHCRCLRVTYASAGSAQ